MPTSPRYELRSRPRCAISSAPIMLNRPRPSPDTGRALLAVNLSKATNAPGAIVHKTLDRPLSLRGDCGHPSHREA